MLLKLGNVHGSGSSCWACLLGYSTERQPAACRKHSWKLPFGFYVALFEGFSVCAGHVLLQVPVVHLQAILLSLFFLKALKFGGGSHSRKAPRVAAKGWVELKVSLQGISEKWFHCGSFLFT